MSPAASHSSFSLIVTCLIVLAVTALACGLSPTVTATPPPTATASLATITVQPPTSTAPPTQPLATVTSELPTPSPAPVSVSFLVIARPDHTAALLSTDGRAQELSTAPQTLYVLANLSGSAAGPQRVYAIGPQGSRSLPFAGELSGGFAASSAAAASAVRLAWDGYTPNADGTLHSQIVVSGVDGSDVRTVVEEVAAAYALRVAWWSPDGQTLYFSKEPVGLGGYILLGGHSNLWAYSDIDGSTAPVVPDAASGTSCLDDLAFQAYLVALHCAPQRISVLDLAMGNISQVLPPPDVAGDAQVLGDARFSPDEQRLAFALARNAPDDEQGWVAVADGLNGNSRLVATSPAGDYFNLRGWLGADTLVLQSWGVTPGVWLVGADGAGLRRVADGEYLGSMSGLEAP